MVRLNASDMEGAARGVMRRSTAAGVARCFMGCHDRGRQSRCSGERRDSDCRLSAVGRCPAVHRRPGPAAPRPPAGPEMASDQTRLERWNLKFHCGMCCHIRRDSNRRLDHDMLGLGGARVSSISSARPASRTSSWRLVIRWTHPFMTASILQTMQHPRAGPSLWFSSAETKYGDVLVQTPISLHHSRP